MVSTALAGSLRVVFYLVILSATIVTIYELLNMKAQVSDEQPGGFCLLWGGSWQNDTALYPFSGSRNVCEFSIISTVSQMLLAILLGVFAVIRIVTGRLKVYSAYSYFELVLVLLASIAGVATAAVLTGGLYKTCHELLAGWPTDPSKSAPYGPKPSSCSSAYFIWPGHNKFTFYHDLTVAHLGAWMSLVCWLLHIFLSCYNCLGYRKGKDDDSESSVPRAISEGRAPGSYRSNSGDDVPLIS